jgi:hypothetical protein
MDGIVCFVTLKLRRRMKTSTKTFPFKKTAACPASATLLSFRAESLPAEAAIVVKGHLETCDFCNAELPLLAHHTASAENGVKTPEMPLELRVLAESILAADKRR